MTMTNKERLEALLMAGACQFLTKGALNCTKLAEYLDEHGALVPPCDIGDYVYDIEDGTAYETRVLHIVYYGNGKWACRTVSSFPDIEDFGSRMFLTSEEAEAGLKQQTEVIDL
ncbi:MAG: hypothetical protein ACI4A5_06325 [Hominilimicola sp.]